MRQMKNKSQDYFSYCLNAYEAEYQRCFDSLISNKGDKASDKMKDEVDKEAQKSAIRVAIIDSLKQFEDAPVKELWADIYRVHLYKKSGISDTNIISKVISADQSWKKSSGHAFEEMVKELATLALNSEDIEVILQRDLNTLIKAGEIDNQPRDISWLKEQIKGNIFDLYCILNKDGKKFCFGCVQAKTSVRDRVTRDREPSIHAMQSYFWSVVFVLDGDFLKLPKFQHMVNGGSEEFKTNGWHGMYAISEKEQNDRIYPLDIDFSTFAEHAKKAADFWAEQRQWLNEEWRADIIDKI